MADDTWSEEELRAAVQSYIKLRDDERSGKKINKAAVYRELAEKYDRAPKSFERRLQNISAAYNLMGRPWLTGLKPASHVGSNVTRTVSG